MSSFLYRIHSNCSWSKKERMIDMHYYYDVLGNFDENYLEFYEWEKNDPITFIKKVPLVRISNKDMLNLLTYKIKVKGTWLEKYKEKTTLKNSKEKPLIILFSSTKTSVLLEFQENGEAVYRSKLLIEDENNCNEYAYSMKEIALSYEKLGKLVVKKEFRKALEDKKILKTELKTLEEEKNLEKCQFLYYEWFGILENDFDKMIKQCQAELTKDYSIKMHQIAELIKLSYKERL